MVVESTRRPPETGDALRDLRRDGEALAAGAELARAARYAARRVVETTRAVHAVVWCSSGDDLEPLAREGAWTGPPLDEAKTLALEAGAAWQPLLVKADTEGSGCTVSIRLGEPPVGVLQLRYPAAPEPLERDAVAVFAARLTHALRLGSRAREVELELGRTRALLAVVGDAIAHLSLAHTLETAVDRMTELLTIDRVGIYLTGEDTLTAAAARDLTAPHEAVASELLGLAAGPFRARETIEVRSDDRARSVARVASALALAGEREALAVPLRAHDEIIGLLVAYPQRGRTTEGERALLAGLAAQLAVAVQNARLHEEAKALGEALGSVLGAERRAAQRLRSLYEISSAFTQGLSLERTLEAITQTIVEVVGVDAAVVRVPDPRGDAFVPGAVAVADPRLAEVVRAILERPQPSFHLTRPLVLDGETVARLGGALALLRPFLAKGATAVLIPISTPTELLARLTILSLDPANPISTETIDTATAIASHAALALDNARLYQQLKAFAETIQRALLPGDWPELPGFDVGAVYESAAQVDVGGDVYDFLPLGDGRIALVLGDVTGHGVDAAADMAMAKFVFRSLAREHPEPADFLAHANEVIADEIAPGKFITMLYGTFDAAGRFVCASAGHPAPRLVDADGAVRVVACRGIALGVEPAQQYDQIEVDVPPGAAIVLFTDGVVETRSGGELYGVDRLDACLADRPGLPAQALAAAVLADCRAFSGSDLRDDCAVVVVRKRP
jgi:serine phosphatase RsbU (regulator of sigma subunit)